MEIVRNANNEVIQFLGGVQKYVKSKQYRFIHYIVEAHVPEGTMMHNTLTGCIVILRPFEIENILNGQEFDRCKGFLVENYFLVPESYNESELVSLYRQKKERPITENYLDCLDSYTILTTTKCNARCPYCYESVLKAKKHMTMETAEKVVAFIKETSFENSPIRFGWFGGEPTFNPEVIDYICDEIGKSGREYHSGMISNGYYFGNEENVKKAVEKWKLDGIQITLDGTEEVYNSTKRFIYKDDPSPFQTVITGICNLINHGIGVSIRMNTDLSNIDHLFELVNWLSRKFLGCKLISFYTCPIFEDVEGGKKRTPEERAELFKKMVELEELIKGNGFSVGSYGFYGAVTTTCMVDSGRSVTILPDGHIGLCEHYIESGYIGHIDNPTERNWDIIKSWRNYIKMEEGICVECPLRPICLKVDKCPNHNICEEAEQAFRVDRERMYMETAWNNRIRELQDRCNNLERQLQDVNNNSGCCSCKPKDN